LQNGYKVDHFFYLYLVKLNKNEIMKLLFKVTGWILSAIILIVMGFMFYSTLMKYNPEKITLLRIHEPVLKNKVGTSEELNLLSWNIGYGGLGREMDFFYEGGKMVRPSAVLCNRYLKNILNNIKSADTSDFIFLQEVDAYAKRTHYIDEVQAVQHKLSEYYNVFAVNYDVPFVPVPVREPMGRVKAGLMTLSRIAPDSAERFALPGSYGWPKRLFLLDRCFIYTQFRLPSGKILSLINLHNSAFGDAVQARQQELALLKKFIVALYKRGHYVVVGGDWNQNPPGFNPSFFVDGNKGYSFEHVPDAFRPADWTWAVDNSKPTNRNVNESFIKGKTLTTVIDFFIVSPNVKVVSVRTVANGFVNSDHQPVAIKVKLK
jgi:endonuclease/exonuclease/phosphatase family metal-dependent hydrolase